MELDGTFVPNVTPFNRHGEIDGGALNGLIDFWLGAGVSGLVVNASTGEAPLLSPEERKDLINIVKEKVGSRGKVIAGTGAIGTRETIQLTRDARDAGAEAAKAVGGELVSQHVIPRPHDGMVEGMVD